MQSEEVKNKLLLLLFKKNEYLFLILRRERNRFVFGAFAVVSYEKGDTSRELFKRADKMMYEGKNRGKNNCCF